MVVDFFNFVFLFQSVVCHALNDAKICNQHISFAESLFASVDSVNEVAVDDFCKESRL